MSQTISTPNMPDWGVSHPYDALVSAGIPIDNHESDLYVLATPESVAILKAHGCSCSSFVSQVDGKRWLDVPFAFKPWWDRRAPKGGQS